MKKELEQLTVNDFKQLMQYVKINGLPLEDLEAMNKISDIIGNQSYDDLAAYANDVNLQDLLFILKYIWPLQDVLNFYNEYSRFSQVACLKEDLAAKEEKLYELETENRELKNKLDNMALQAKIIISKAESML